MEQKANERVLAIFDGREPDRTPFISRLDFWYKGLTYQKRLPAKYIDMSLEDIHQAVGIGQEEWMSPYAFKYRNLELVVFADEQKILHEQDPEIDFFPDLWGHLPVDQAREMTVEMRTPIGSLVSIHAVTEDSLKYGVTRPHVLKHPVADLDDFKIYEYIIEHSDFVPHFDQFFLRVEELGGSGFLVPTLNRVPFQSLLIDVMGEIACFYGLYDNPGYLERLMQVIDEQTAELLQQLTGFDYPYIEFIDNLDGMMTNPRLFPKYALPSYQKYSEVAHQQGKKLGSHTDGNLKGLMPLLAESGLDVCESFTPAPMTACTVDEALTAWGTRPLIWGGIPSCHLETRTAEEEFQRYVFDLLARVHGHPIILGVADAVMSDNLIERVTWISQQINAFHV